MAKTVFERLAKIVPGFDRKATNDCLFFADRRNAELHSGETPFVGIDHIRVAPTFWTIAKKIVEGHEPPRSLEDWLGPDEAASVEAIISDHQETVTQIVLRRITRHEQQFDAKYPVGSLERSELAGSPVVDILPSRFQTLGDHAWQATCPACELPGWMFGIELDRDVIDTIAEYERDEFGEVYAADVYDLVEVFYEGESFRCIHCELHLDGLRELEIAELDTDNTVETHDEHIFEPDYGND